MRSVRKMFAWLPLWALVLLAGGCDWMASKDVKTFVYFILPRNECGYIVKDAEGKQWFPSGLILDDKMLAEMGEIEFIHRYREYLKNSNAFCGWWLGGGHKQVDSRENYEQVIQFTLEFEDGRKEEVYHTVTIPYLETGGFFFQDIELHSRYLGIIYGAFEYRLLMTI